MIKLCASIFLPSNALLNIYFSFSPNVYMYLKFFNFEKCEIYTKAEDIIIMNLSHPRNPTPSFKNYWHCI